MNKFQLFIWRTCVVLVILSISFAFIKVTGAIIKFSREEPGSSVYTAQEPATPPAKSAKCIALTFDDGPHPDFTLKILSVLERHETKATFFVVGKMVVKHEGLLRAIHEYGHDIGTHTFNHPMLTSLSSEAVADELEKGRSTINILTGEKVVFFRPPSGRYNSEIVNLAAAHSLYTILWSNNSMDYGSTNSKEIEARVLANPVDGDIVLLHSGVKATLEALPVIIEGLKERGFELKTLSDMMKEKCGKPKFGLFKSFQPSPAVAAGVTGN